jgi:hypothetical protein
MRLYLIIHVKRCQDKNMTCHGNPSPSDQCMSRTRCYDWFKRFKDGWQSTYDVPRLG